VVAITPGRVDSLSGGFPQLPFGIVQDSPYQSIDKLRESAVANHLSINILRLRTFLQLIY
jgi:hypothetical protein